MHQLIKTYQSTPIQFEIIDGQVFANATEMCQAFGKRPTKWLELESTKRYIEALQVKSEKRTSLVETRKGNSSEFNQGTWIHEKLILKLAQWLNVDFEIWCDEQLSTLLRDGSVSLSESEKNHLLPHTTRPVQIESSKGANAFSFSKGGKLACIDWSVKESLFFTGKRPSELKAIAKERGVPLKNRTSGKEVVRYYRPEVASAMSIADTLYRHGIEDTTALNAAKSAIPALQLLGQIEAQKLLSTKN